MNILIKYGEIHDFVNKSKGKNVTLGYVDPKTVKVTYHQKVFVATVPVPVSLKVVEVKPSAVKIAYPGGKMADLVVEGVLEFFKDKLKGAYDAISVREDHTINIDLLKIEEAKEVLKWVALENIEFNEEGIDVALRLI